MKRVCIYDDGTARELFEYIKKSEEDGDSVVISSFPSPDASEEYKQQASEFDHRFYIEMSNENAVLLRNDENHLGIAFLKCELREDDGPLEMYHLDTEYGRTFLGNVTGVR